jgi:hypothetical protein
MNNPNPDLIEKLTTELASAKADVVKFDTKATQYFNGLANASLKIIMLKAEAAATASRLAEVEQQLADYKFVLGNRRDHQFVDASPDAGLPVRILRAYIESGSTLSEPKELGELMNKWQADRNGILLAAIGRLSATTTDLARVNELEKDKARLDFLESDIGAVGWRISVIEGKVIFTRPDLTRYPTLRAAIDAARPASGDAGKESP